jgi:hypothetical protein
MDDSLVCLRLREEKLEFDYNSNDWTICRHVLRDIEASTPVDINLQRRHNGFEIDSVRLQEWPQSFAAATENSMAVVRCLSANAKRLAHGCK